MIAVRRFAPHSQLFELDRVWCCTFGARVKLPRLTLRLYVILLT